MGELSYTTGGDSNLVSFRSAARVPITSLKCNFTPIQEGSGDPSPENVRPISGWNSVTVYEDDIYLPVEYQRIEYLQSTGEQYIITNVEPSLTIIYETLQRFNSNDNDSFVIGFKDNDNRICSNGRYNGKLQVMYGGTYNLIGNAFDDTLYKIKSEMSPGLQRYYQNEQLIEEIHTPKGSSEIITKHIGLFCRIANDTTPEYKAKIKLYYAKILNENNVLLGYFIPCRRKSDNKPGMYDTVSQTFFTNQGTGEFICGPDVGKKVPITFYENLYITSTKTQNTTLNTSGEEISEVEMETTDYISVVEGSKYIIKYTSTYGARTRRIMGYDSSDNFVESLYSMSWATVGNTLSSTITIPTGISKIKICMYTKDTDISFHTENPITIYGGYVDIAKGELKQEWKNNTFTANSSFPYRRFMNNQFGLGMLITHPDGVNSINLLCDCMPIYTDDLHTSQFPYIYKMEGEIEGKTILMIMLGFLSEHPEIDTSTTELAFSTIYEYYQAQFTKYNLTNINVYYNNKSAQKIYNCSPKQLKTLLDQNHIWTNTNSNTEVSYAIHDSAMIRSSKKQIIVNEPHIETASGTIANFSTDLAAPLREAKIYFNPIQEGEGDPSPENMREISGWNGINIMSSQDIVKINILGEQSQTYNETICNYLGNNTFELINDGSSRSFSFPLANNIILNQGETYYPQFIFDPSSEFTNVNVGLRVDANTNAYGATANYINNTWIYTGNGRTLSNNHIATIVRVSFNTGCTYVKFKYILSRQPITTSMLNFNNIYYGGYVDLINGELVETWHKIVADGVNVKCNSSYMTDDVIAAGIVYLNPTGKNSPFSQANINVFMDTIPIYTSNYEGNHSGEIQLPYATCTCAGAQYIVFKIANRADHPEVTDAATCKEFVNNWLQEHPTTIVYQLKTPIVYQLTPTQLKTLKGTNNIWSNANGPIEVKYWTH